MRKARNKVRKAFAINKPGSEEFGMLMEKYSHEYETYAAYKEYLKGRDYNRLDPEEKRTLLCEII